jgi:hypothetical protein
MPPLGLSVVAAAAPPVWSVLALPPVSNARGLVSLLHSLTHSPFSSSAPYPGRHLGALWLPTPTSMRPTTLRTAQARPTTPSRLDSSRQPSHPASAPVTGSRLVSPLFSSPSSAVSSAASSPPGTRARHLPRRPAAATRRRTAQPQRARPLARRYAQELLSERVELMVSRTLWASSRRPPTAST